MWDTTHGEGVKRERPRSGVARPFGQPGRQQPLGSGDVGGARALAILPAIPAVRDVIDETPPIDPSRSCHRSPCRVSGHPRGARLPPTHSFAPRGPTGKGFLARGRPTNRPGIQDVTGGATGGGQTGRVDAPDVSHSSSHSRSVITDWDKSAEMPRVPKEIGGCGTVRAHRNITVMDNRSRP